LGILSLWDKHFQKKLPPETHMPQGNIYEIAQLIVAYQPRQQELPSRTHCSKPSDVISRDAPQKNGSSRVKTDGCI